MEKTKYTHRFLAHIVIEAKTPLAVGCGEKDILTDALVATDVNGLPYIPGTAIAGVVRHMIDVVKPVGFDTNQIFGFQDKKDGRGSEIIFTEAKILNSKGEVIDGMYLNAKEDDLLKHYDKLPVRQHVRINEKGVNAGFGKFDEQVVFAGTRFCFELEMVAKNATIDNFNKILEQIQNRSFRIGGGTRCGFGEVEVVDLQTRVLDLNVEGQRNEYLDKSSALNSDFWNKEYTKPEIKDDSDGWMKYKLEIQPEDFFLFGSGFGDDEVDMTPVKDAKVDWSSGKGVFKEDMVLIPATSVKGALAHRTAFHFNRLKERFVGCIGDKEPKVGNENEAVQVLFGYENQKQKKQVRGNVLLSDVIEKKLDDKILNHVAIDRFTGSAIDGALFSEKTTYGKGQTFEMTILVNKKAIGGEKIQEAFEEALKDVCKGLLPLGGGVNRGNGVFTGTLKRDNELIYPQKEA